MNILTIMGTPHKGNTRAVVDLFLKEFEGKSNSFDEIVLPLDFNNICMGCANCILKSEDRKMSGKIAPSCGLYLRNVFY